MSVFGEIAKVYIIERLEATWKESINEERSQRTWEKVGFDMELQKSLNDTNRQLITALKEDILKLPIKDDKTFYEELRALLQTRRQDIYYKNVVRPEVLNVNVFISHLQQAIDLLNLIFTRFTELELLVPHDKDPLNEFTYAVARYVARNISLDINPDMMRSSQKSLAKEKEELTLKALADCLKKIDHLKEVNYLKTKKETVIETLKILLKNNREKCDKRAEFSLGFMKVQLPSVQPGYGFLDTCMSEALACIQATMEDSLVVQFTADKIARSPDKDKEPTSYKKDVAALASSAAISPEESIKSIEPSPPESHQQSLLSENPSSTFFSTSTTLSKKERKELERHQKEKSSSYSSAASSNP